MDFHELLRTEDVQQELKRREVRKEIGKPLIPGLDQVVNPIVEAMTVVLEQRIEVKSKKLERNLKMFKDWLQKRGFPVNPAVLTAHYLYGRAEQVLIGGGDNFIKEGRATRQQVSLVCGSVMWDFGDAYETVMSGVLTAHRRPIGAPKNVFMDHKVAPEQERLLGEDLTGKSVAVYVAELYIEAEPHIETLGILIEPHNYKQFMIKGAKLGADHFEKYYKNVEEITNSKRFMRT